MKEVQANAAVILPLLGSDWNHRFIASANESHAPRQHGASCGAMLLRYRGARSMSQRPELAVQLPLSLRTWPFNARMQRAPVVTAAALPDGAHRLNRERGAGEPAFQ